MTPSTNPERQQPDHPEWCRVTLASIGEAVITTDAEGRVTFLNSFAETLTGWTQDEAIGVPLDRVFKTIDQVSRNSVESPSVRSLRDGVIVGLANHSLLLAKDGTERPIEDCAAPIRSATGSMVGVVLVFRDITARFHQEQILASAASYTASIIATLREPFVVLDRDLRVKTANRAFYEAFHTEADVTEGQLLSELGNGQWNIPRLRSLLDEILVDRQTVHDYNVEHDFPDIGRKHMLLNACRFQSANGDPDLILLAIEDVSARKRAEADVQISEAQYRRLFQTAKDGIIILDAETGKVIDANPFMTELLGYSCDEFLGKELWEIGLFSDKLASQSLYRELHEQGYIRSDHLPLQAKSGQRAEVEFVCNTYQVNGKSVAQCNIRDISERSRLEKKIHEQTVALADLHRRKDEFLAMLSHELRSPLAPIANAVHMLRLQPSETPLQLQARTIIERQMTLLTRLVDDLMEVSRITTGRVQLRLERVLVNGIVERAVETARPIIERHQHELTVSLSPEPIWLYADASRLEQVVVNLLTNAAKYTPEGGQIGLAVEMSDDECVLRVRDTGVGIASELLPRIFDLFTQAEQSLDRSQGGLGIGLAVVQRLVELHGGRVKVLSELGQGTEFVVHLPVMPFNPKESLLPLAEAASPIAHRLRVLVVDDNVDAAVSLAMLLRMSGHDVWMAHTGSTVVEAMSEHDPNVVLLDIGLPGLDGLQVARRIRELPRHADVVLVAMTGYGQEADHERSQAAGFDHHLVKPADFSKVQEILANVKRAV
ncbi:MAG: PAS domain S-box protein [Acidobacteriota bacterium]